MNGLHLISELLDDRARGERLYAGDVLVFKDVPAMRAFCAASDGLVREVFGDLDPRTAHTLLEPGDFLERAKALRVRHRKDPAIQARLLTLLEALGVDPSLTYWDRLFFRVQPPTAGPSDYRTRSLPAHRDTWGSNIMAQANWWAPLYPISAERTILLYPRYFARAIANTSADWNHEVLMENRRALSRGETVEPYPSVPVPTEAPDPADAIPVVIEPGDVLCFSSAHLHASTTNATDEARFSIELRTVNLDDLREGRGAPNVDGAAPRVQYRWFNRLSDDAPLEDLVVQTTG